MAKKKDTKTLKEEATSSPEYLISIHGSGGEIIIGELEENKYLQLSENNDGLEDYIFDDHDDAHNVNSFWGMSTEATVDVYQSDGANILKEEIIFDGVITDSNTTCHEFKNSNCYFLGFSLNEGESFSCSINEEFDISRLMYKFFQFDTPEITDIILTDVSYISADGDKEIQFSSDGDTTHKGNLFNIFRGSDCANASVEAKPVDNNSREALLEALENEGIEVLETADGSLLADRAFILAAISEDGLALQYADKALKSDREFILEAVKENCSTLEYADDNLKADRQLVLEAVKQDGEALEFVNENFRTDREVVLEAVKATGWVLAYADDSLKADREIVLEAVKQDGDALEYASEELQQDEELKKISEG